MNSTMQLNLSKYQVLKHSLRDMLASLERIQPNCHGCRHFENGITCTLFGTAPPEAFSKEPEQCESWEWDGVPF